MRFRKSAAEPEKIRLQMTPMIDVVFQLLVFFLLTFKIVLPEGDFNIKMPRDSAQPTADPNPLPLIKVRLRGDAAGELVEISLNDASFGVDYDAFQRRLIDVVGGESTVGSARDSAEVELETDYDLKYRYTAEAISRISGYIQNDRIIKLIEKVRLAPPVEPEN